MPRAVLVLVAVLSVAALAGGAQQQQQRVIDHDYVGADRCKSCHADAYTAWEKSPHARAFEALSPKDRTDARCLQCHTMVPDDAAAGLTGIQCESCHGAGRHYSVDYVMKDAELRKAIGLLRGDSTSCVRCHTDSSPGLVPFVAADKLALIKHWK